MCVFNYHGDLWIYINEGCGCVQTSHGVFAYGNRINDSIVELYDQNGKYCGEIMHTEFGNRVAINNRKIVQNLNCDFSSTTPAWVFLTDMRPFPEYVEEIPCPDGYRDFTQADIDRIGYIGRNRQR